MDDNLPPGVTVQDLEDSIGIDNTIAEIGAVWSDGGHKTVIVVSLITANGDSWIEFDIEADGSPTLIVDRAEFLRAIEEMRDALEGI